MTSLSSFFGKYKFVFGESDVNLLWLKSTNLCLTVLLKMELDFRLCVIEITQSQERKSYEKRYRWVGNALLEIERKMRRINNYKKLHLMIQRLLEEVQKQIESIRVVA